MELVVKNLLANAADPVFGDSACLLLVCVCGLFGNKAQHSETYEYQFSSVAQSLSRVRLFATP